MTATSQFLNPAPPAVEVAGRVYCFVCTHTVEAKVMVAGPSAKSKAGQSCPRCNSTLDAAHVVFAPQA